jgi:hypothetical protein
MTGVFLFLEVRVLWKDFTTVVSKRDFSYKLIPKRVAINYSVSARYILTESELTKTGNKIKLNEDIHMNILASLDDI